jgi:acetyl-CoA synthetase
MRREPYSAGAGRIYWNDVRAALGWPATGKVSLGASILDRHATRDNAAMIWIGKDGTHRRVSYRELTEGSNRFAPECP